MTARAKRRRGGPTCPLCAAPIDENKLTGVMGRMAPDEDITDHAGEGVEIDLCGMPVSAVVPGLDAPMRAKGVEVLFLVCGRDCATAIRIAAFLDAEADGRHTDPAAEILEGLRCGDPTHMRTDANVKRLKIFEATLQAHAPRIAKRLGLTALPPRYGPGATAEERETVDTFLRQSCAWCRRRIPDDDPVEGLHVWLVENPDRVQDSGFITMTIAGRSVFVQLVEPGSAAASSCDAVFILCSKDCVAALTAAIHSDLRMKVAH